MKMRELMLALAVSAGLCSFSFADITGTVKFEGEVPEPEQVDLAAVKDCAAQHPDGLFNEVVAAEDGKLANVIVSIKPAEGKELGGEPSSEPAFLDQKGCQYVPRVVGVMVGQKFLVANSDPFLHNVHGLPLDNDGFNFGQPTIDKGKALPPMKVAEDFKIKCDVHPWMSAHVHVFEHPYFAVTKKDGTFKIPAAKLADGKYTLVAKHETLGEKQAEVTVKGGKAEATFSFAATDKKAAADAPAAAEVTLASLTAAAPAAPKAEACDACCDKDKAKATAAGKTVAAAK